VKRTLRCLFQIINQLCNSPNNNKSDRHINQLILLKFMRIRYSYVFSLVFTVVYTVEISGQTPVLLV